MQRASKRLPNRIVNNYELQDWADENIPGFAGIIPRNEFTADYLAELSPGQSIIINLDPNYSQGGTHWTALRISSDHPIIYYKDSFGLPTPAEVRAAVNEYNESPKNGRGYGIIYGNRKYQDIEEENCGRRSAEFLRDMHQAAANGGEIEYFHDYEY